MGEIIEAAQLPEAEKVYLKKDFLGWRVVHPIKNEDGSLNWFNLIFGSPSNLVFLIILALVCIGLYFGINELISNYQAVADNPCAFCTECQAQCRSVISGLKIPTKELVFNLTGIE